MTGLAMLPWFPGDFMKSTRGWSVTAKGVYRELLDAQWDIGGLPAEPSELRSLIGASEDEWSIGWTRCETKFPVCDDGLRRNRRLEEHRAESEQRRRIAREHGQAGAKGRWSKKGKGHESKNATDGRALPEQSEGTTGAMPEECPPSPSPSPPPSPSPSPSSAQAKAAARARTRGAKNGNGKHDPEAAQLAAQLREYRINIGDDDRHLRDWMNDGITIGRLIEVIAIARLNRGDDKLWPQVIQPEYINTLVRDHAVADPERIYVHWLHRVMRGECKPDEHIRLPACSACGDRMTGNPCSSCGARA